MVQKRPNLSGGAGEDSSIYVRRWYDKFIDNPRKGVTLQNFFNFREYDLIPSYKSISVFDIFFRLDEIIKFLGCIAFDFCVIVLLVQIAPILELADALLALIVSVFSGDFTPVMSGFSVPSLVLRLHEKYKPKKDKMDPLKKHQEELDGLLQQKGMENNVKKKMFLDTYTTDELEKMDNIPDDAEVENEILGKYLKGPVNNAGNNDFNMLERVYKKVHFYAQNNNKITREQLKKVDNLLKNVDFDNVDKISIDNILEVQERLGNQVPREATNFSTFKQKFEAFDKNGQDPSDNFWNQHLQPET